MLSSLTPEHSIQTITARAATIKTGAGDNVSKQQRTLHQWQGETMGTRYRVCFVAEKNINLPAIQHEIQKVVDEVDNQMSTWKADSALSRFNRSSSRAWVDVPASLAYVVSEALNLSRITDGAFDVTMGSAVNLWGFGPEGNCTQLPDAGKIQHSKITSGYKNLHARLEPPALCKTSDCYIDLSGIAKGFGVDQMAQALDDMKIKDYLVAIDGELRVRGTKLPAGTPWTVAVETPVPDTRQAYDLLSPGDCSIATSGDYRNFVVLNNKHYCHTIDAKTAQPIDNAVGSVTVCHRSCMMADAWATALLVLGPDKGAEVAEAHCISALFLLREENELHDIMTPGFAAVVDG